MPGNMHCGHAKYVDASKGTTRKHWAERVICKSGIDSNKNEKHHNIFYPLHVTDFTFARFLMITLIFRSIAQKVLKFFCLCGLRTIHDNKHKITLLSCVKACRFVLRNVALYRKVNATCVNLLGKSEREGWKAHQWEL